MINIHRAINEPPELLRQRNLAVGSCSVDGIRVPIANMFFNKCYLCETDKSPFAIEHLESHGGEREIKFRWNNLFYSCPTCNSIKSTTYDTILDCCDFAFIITNSLNFHMNDQDVENFIVEISTADNTPSTLVTVELLNLCYEG